MRTVPAAVTAALLLLGLSLTTTGSVAPGAGQPGGPAPAEFVALSEVAPDIRQEIRYATEENFVGTVVDGYREPVCLLTRDAAEALARVQRGLAERGLGLLVFDCYRPQRAVDHFLRWADDPADTATRADHYPRVPKERLFEEGYLAERSGHSRGSTVDLTLVRPSGEEVDMGTDFDFFDPRSAFDAPDVTDAQRAARAVLREAMVAEGFEPLEMEWWHFGYQPEPYPDRHFDVPVAEPGGA